VQATVLFECSNFYPFIYPLSPIPSITLADQGTFLRTPRAANQASYNTSKTSKALHCFFRAPLSSKSSPRSSSSSPLINWP